MFEPGHKAVLYIAASCRLECKQLFGCVDPAPERCSDSVGEEGCRIRHPYCWHAGMDEPPAMRL